LRLNVSIAKAIISGEKEPGKPTIEGKYKNSIVKIVINILQMMMDFTE
jgi:hypothetical protein